jgi:hypothetical protein
VLTVAITRRNTLLAAVVVLGGAIGTATSLGAAEDPGPSDPPSPRAERAQVESVQPRLKAELEVLRERRDAADTLPPAVEDVTLTDDSVTPSGENGDLSRRARTAPGNASIYVVPGNGAVCLFLGTGSGDDAVARGGCGYAGTALAGGEYRVAGGADLGLPGGHALAYGLAPDGVESATVTLPSGTTTEAPVVNSVWVAQIPEGETTTITVGETVLKVEAPDPSSPRG